MTEKTEKKQLNALDKANQATECLARGFNKSALELLNEAIKVDPENCGFYAKRSAAYFQQENYAKALADAETAIEKNSAKSNGHVRKMMTLMHTGEIDAASAAAKEALKPADLQKNPTVLSLVASIQYIKGEYGDAIVTCRTLLDNTDNEELLCKGAKIIGASLNAEGKDKFKNDSAAGKSLGMAKVGGAKFDEANEKLNEEDITGQVEDLISSGQRFASHGNLQSAITHWESALLLAQVQNLTSLVKSVGAKLASAYRRVGRPDRSAMVLSSCSEEAEGYRGLANTAFSNGNFPRAIELFKKVLDLEIEEGDEEAIGNAHNNVACVHLACGANAKAIESFNQGLAKAKSTQCSPAMITALNGLGSVALKQDKAGDAFTHLNAALDALPLLHDQLVADFPEDDSKHNLYRALFTQTYRSIIEMYQQSGKNDLAFEWSERSKSFGYFDAFGGKCEEEGSNDVTTQEIKDAVVKVKKAFISFTFLTRTSIVASFLAADGSVDTKVLPWAPTNNFDVSSFVHQVQREGEDETSEDAFVAWKETEKRESVEAGKILRPSLEQLARLYDALLKPFEKLIQAHGSNGVVIVPHGGLFDVPFSQLIPSRDNHEERFGQVYPIILACSAAEWVRQQEKQKSDGPLKTVLLLKDTTVPEIAEIESAISPDEVLDGSKDGIDTFKKVGESSVDIVHFAPRCTRVEVAKAHEARVDSVLGRKLVSRKDVGGVVAIQAIGDVSLKGHGNQGWIYFCEGDKPFTVTEDIATVKADKAVPVHKLHESFKVPEGSVVVLDLSGAPEDIFVESWGAPLIRASLNAGASSVVVIRHPSTKRVDIVKAFYHNVKNEDSVPKAVRATVKEIREISPNPVDCGAIAVFQ